MNIDRPEQHREAILPRLNTDLGNSGAVLATSSEVRGEPLSLGHEGEIYGMCFSRAT